MSLLKLENVEKIYRCGDSAIKVLDGICFELERLESVALVGASGTGKTTLLQLAALLEKPSAGKIFINNVCVSDLSDEQKTKVRRDNIGFVYQFHNLLPEFNALENILIPQFIKKINRKEATARAFELLENVGMVHRANHLPSQMSGGEQQRIAIARALANNPNMIIADEPTGNLDPINSEIVFDLFLELIKKNNSALLMATHNIELSKKLSRVVTMQAYEKLS